MAERVNTVLEALPRGDVLEDSDWARRHRLLLWLLAAHVPGLALLGVLTDQPPTLLAAGAGAVALPLLVAIVGRGRSRRAAALTLGLLASASLAVHMTGGRPEAHFHYFVVIALVALYQDWRPYLISLAAIVLVHGVGGTLVPASVYADPEAAARPWLWAAVHSAFIVAVCTAQILLWQRTQQAHRAAREHFGRLYEDERAAVDKLRAAQTVKDQLIAVVGHEFRTPLTAIQGFARTLEARFDRMDADAVQTCTLAIERETKRLTRMVANLLAASEEIVPSWRDRAVLRDVVTAVVADVVETTPMAARNVRTHVPASHVARMTPDLAHQLLFNLVDNAVKFAVDDSDVRVTSRRDGATVVVEVANVGLPIPPSERDRIFDAFIQGDSSDTRRWGGIGLGLHIARKIVDAHGGRIGAFAEGPLVIFRVWLPAATDAVTTRPPSANSLAG